MRNASQHQRCQKELNVNPAIFLLLSIFAGRSISTALSAGAALAVTSAIIDAGGQTTRIDNGKEYYAYTTKKKSNVDQ